MRCLCCFGFEFPLFAAFFGEVAGGRKVFDWAIDRERGCSFGGGLGKLVWLVMMLRHGWRGCGGGGKLAVR